MANEEIVAIAEEIGIVEPARDFTTIVNEVGLLTENAIPVPLSYGKLTEERFSAAVKFYKRFHDDWKEISKEFSETGSSVDGTDKAPKENFVRLVVNSLLEQTYMRNPVPEYTFIQGEPDAQTKAEIDALSAAVTRLCDMRHGTGLNLKNTVKMQIVRAHLTNWGIVRIVYTPYHSSRESRLEAYYAAEKLLRETEDLANARDKYAAISRLYDEAMTMKPFGLSIRIVSPFNFFVQPTATKEDLTDADYTFEIEAIPLEQIKYNYCKRKDDSDEYVYRYDTRRVLKTGETFSSASEAYKNRIIADIMPEASKEENEVLKENMIPCVHVFDKVIRKHVLYIMDQFDTPLWVSEDELELSRFFPYFIMAFTPSIAALPRFGEPSYYLRHQQVINDNTKMVETIKNAAATLVVYDTEAIDKKEVDKVLDEAIRPSRALRSIGVKLRSPERKLEDVWGPFKFPVTQLLPLFDDAKSRQSINATARVNSAMRGEEFRTNTTNQAIETYNTFSSARASAMIDVIEETLAQIYQSINEIVVSKFTKQQIADLIGQDKSVAFSTMTVKDFNNRYQVDIEGGSIEKPTSDNKKKEAVSIIQMLGQFGKAAPSTVLSIVTRMLRTTFSRHLVSDADLETLKQEGQAAMTKGVSQPTENTNA